MTLAGPPVADEAPDHVALIRRILADRAVFPSYQPIVELDTGRLVGVEALARGPAGSPVERPEALFSAAQRAGELPLLDQLCAARALEVARDAGDVPPLVFVNAEPSVLHHPFTPELLAVVTSTLPFRIVLEFTERALPEHPASLLRIAAGVHHLGNAVALDDVGADPLSLALLPLIEPEVVKLDLRLLRQWDAPNTMDIVSVVSEYVARTGAVIVAEGIETAEDLAAARSFGAAWGQGWLFAQPGPIEAVRTLPVQRRARLRPARPGLHQPPGTPYGLAAAADPSHRADAAALSRLCEQLLAGAADAGAYTVVLGAYRDPGLGRAWVDRSAAVARRGALVGLLGPGLDEVVARQSARLRYAPLLPDELGGETALVAIAPGQATALCARPEPDGGFRLVRTDDREAAYAVARLLLGRLDTVAGALTHG